MVAVLDQIDQQVEHLRFDGNMLAAAGQFAQAGVEHMVGKVELHVDFPVFHPLIPAKWLRRGRGDDGGAGMTGIFTGF